MNDPEFWDVVYCQDCGRAYPQRNGYCPECGASLPMEKSAEFFDELIVEDWYIFFNGCWGIVGDAGYLHRKEDYRTAEVSYVFYHQYHDGTYDVGVPIDNDHVCWIDQFGKIHPSSELA